MLSRIAQERRKWRSLNRFAGAGVLAAAAFAATAVPASAQIYTWRDDNGNLVVSDRRPSTETTTPTFAVPKAADVRATRPVAVTRWTTFVDLITEHARAQGVRADLVRAVMQVESAFNP